jgi:hypothetical protein
MPAIALTAYLFQCARVPNISASTSTCGRGEKLWRCTLIFSLVVALLVDAADDGIWGDRRHWVLRAELKFLSNKPALRAAASWKICPSFIGRYGEEFVMLPGSKDQDIG